MVADTFTTGDVAVVTCNVHLFHEEHNQRYERVDAYFCAILRSQLCLKNNR